MREKKNRFIDDQRQPNGRNCGNEVESLLRNTYNAISIYSIKIRGAVLIVNPLHKSQGD